MINYVTQSLKTDKGEFITSNDLTQHGKHLLITGAAGSGKTTLCSHIFSTLIGKYQKSKADIYPYLLKAKHFNNSEIFENPKTLLAYANSNGESEVPSTNSAKQNLFIIDGLDEVRDKYDIISMSISKYFQINKEDRVILTSRPGVDLSNFNTFEKCELQSFSLKDAYNFIKLSLPEKEANSFMTIINSGELNKFIYNPLLLFYSINIFKSHGNIPNNLYRIVESTVEYLLSSWDSIKNIGARSVNTLAINLDILCNLSYYLNYKGKSIFTFKDFKTAIKVKDPENVINYFVQRGILINNSIDTYSFSHKSIEEYFVAKYFRNYEETTIIKNKPLHFFPQIFEFLIESKDIQAVKKYVFQTDIDRKDSIVKLINLFDINVSNLTAANNPVEPEPKADYLKSEWLKLLNQNDLVKKGKQFEVFIQEFISSQFKIVSRNILTHNGEFDLIIENKSNDPFWSEFNTDYLVECKFWNKNIPIHEVLAFSQKTVNSRVKLGFFISIPGFTKDALRAFENIASNSTSSIVIPISKSDLSNYVLLGERDMNEFLKTLVRKIKYKKKY